MPTNDEITLLKKKIAELEAENERLRQGMFSFNKQGPIVSAAPEFEKTFAKAEKTVGRYFTGIDFLPSEGTIQINDERYVLVRASALSFDFFNKILDLYKDRGEAEALIIGKNFLFDISHVIGIEDARSFHEKMKITDPLSKLAAGPVHFAYSGWASVDILEGNPLPGDSFYLKYHHPYSFEAWSWIKRGQRSDTPVCVMNAGYSSGWVEESYGIPLTAVEVSCQARGDAHCTFIMAPPHRIHEYLPKHQHGEQKSSVYDVPMFFERKKAEEQIKASLREKEVLLKEIHHRVKNNLQIISSLLKLQSSYTSDENVENVLLSSQQRIKTMAIVHEKLYQSDLQFVNVASYIRSIAQMAYDTFSDTKKNVDFEYEFIQEIIYFKIDKAIPCGLIINEIITNSFKYAFDGLQKGTIFISLTRTEKHFRIQLSDDGIGMPATVGPGISNTLGFELIEILSQQIDATVEVQRGKGTTYVITVPLDE